MNTEQEMAIRIAHQEKVAKILARTGGEIINPRHYDFREDLRNEILEAIDSAAGSHGMKTATDGDLPEIFKSIDSWAEKLFNRTMFNSAE